MFDKSYFEFSMLSIRFSFSKKNGKQNTVHFLFFIFMEELKIELLKNIKINTLWLF